MRISNVYLRIIKDSRGEDTLEARMISNQTGVTSSVPAGKSKGKHEVFSIAPILALQKLEQIKDKILNQEFSDILEFDNFLKNLDNTPNKSNLGGNLILVLSICFAKLFAKVNNLQTYQLIANILNEKLEKFPYLYFNLIGGGLHAKDSVPFQEQILVTKFKSPAEGLEYAKSVVEKLREDIETNFGEIRMGDEGTFSIKSNNPTLGLEVLSRNSNSQNVGFALDVAASSFYSNGLYRIGEKNLNTAQTLNLYRELFAKFPLISIEDPFSEDDSTGFGQICEMLIDKTLIIGDDLTVTNKVLLQKAIDAKLLTGVIIKPNQIGSVSETLDAIRLAKNNNIKIIVSHRSGETNDDFIADLAFGAQAYGLKSGAPTQPQRLAKYNRLIEIEREVNQ